MLLYGSETLSATHAQRLAALDSRALRRVLGIRWQYRLTNEELRRRSLQPSLQRLQSQCKARWLRHVLRMDEDHPTRRIFDFDPCTAGWRRPHGRPRTRWTDVIRDDFRDLDLILDQTRDAARNRASWRLLVSRAASTPHRHEN